MWIFFQWDCLFQYRNSVLNNKSGLTNIVSGKSRPLKQTFSNGSAYHLIAKQTTNTLMVFKPWKGVKRNSLGLSPYKLESSEQQLISECFPHV